MDELLALVQIHLRIVAGEPVSRSANGEALFIQQAANLPNDQHVLALIVAAVAAPLDRLELGKLLLVGGQRRLGPGRGLRARDERGRPTRPRRRRGVDLSAIERGSGDGDLG